jgi:hypothetical protein
MPTKSDLYAGSQGQPGARHCRLELRYRFLQVRLRRLRVNRRRHDVHLGLAQQARGERAPRFRNVTTYLPRSRISLRITRIVVNNVTKTVYVQMTMDVSPLFPEFLNARPTSAWGEAQVRVSGRR